jgi:hypothetical protein
MEGERENNLQGVCIRRLMSGEWLRMIESS